MLTRAQWQYFMPIQEGMAKNCSADVSRVVDYVDQVSKYGTKAQQKKLQTLFGLGDLEHYDDFAAYVIHSIPSKPDMKTHID